MASKDEGQVAREKPAIEAVEAPAATPANNVEVKEVNVQSVELADAVAKDKPNYRCRSQIALYGFMLFATLSKCQSGLRSP